MTAEPSRKQCLFRIECWGVSEHAFGGPVRLGEDSQPIHTQPERCLTLLGKFLSLQEQLSVLLSSTAPQSQNSSHTLPHSYYPLFCATSSSPFTTVN